MVEAPDSRLVPLNWVVCTIRLISWVSWSTSNCSWLRLVSLTEPLEACTAISRIRCRLLEICPRAPSAVWPTEIPSLALRTAWLPPRMALVRPSEIAKPAASSLALLTRRPEDRRCRELFKEDWEVAKLRCALRDAMLVLTTMDMVFS